MSNAQRTLSCVLERTPTLMVHTHSYFLERLIGHGPIYRVSYSLSLRGWIPVAVSIVLVTVMSGCAGYHARPLSTRSGAEAIQNRTLDREALKKPFRLYTFPILRTGPHGIYPN